MPNSTGPLRPWVGQLTDEPRTWFLVWATSKERARTVIQRDIGDVRARTMREIKGPGYFLFRAEIDPTSGPAWTLLPPEGECLILTDPSDKEWIAENVRAAEATRRRPVAGEVVRAVAAKRDLA